MICSLTKLLDAAVVGQQESEYVEMMNSIVEYQMQELKRQKTTVKKSRRASETRMNEPTLVGKRWSVAPKLQVSKSHIHYTRLSLFQNGAKHPDLTHPAPS